jgi:putative addiction module killer protein
MIEIRQTETFADWLADLKDERARAKISVRIRRLSLGNPGDVKPVGEGVSELRIDYGPGYRLYFVRRGAQLIVLLCGGDKTTQAHDIETAKSMAKQLKDENDDA